VRTVQQETARPPWDSPRRCPASPCPSGSPANLRGQAGGCLPSPPQRRTRTRRAPVACSTSRDSGSTELVYRGSTGHLPGRHRSADRRIPTMRHSNHSVAARGPPSSPQLNDRHHDKHEQDGGRVEPHPSLSTLRRVTARLEQRFVRHRHVLGSSSRTHSTNILLTLVVRRRASYQADMRSVLNRSAGRRAD